MIIGIGFWLLGLVSGSELICSGPEAESCYPRIFEATSDFQRVFDDQELPGGLHVRLDLESGKKEAKLAVAGDTSNAVIVSQSIEEEENNQVTTPREDIVGGTESVGAKDDGRVVPPRDGGALQAMFDQSVAKILDGSDLHRAFADLEEVAHDMFFGLQLIESEVFGKMIKWLTPSDEPEYQGEIATIIGSALRNNPKALAVCVTANPAFLDRLLNLLPRTTTTVKIKVIYLMHSLLAGPGQMNAFKWFDGNKVLRGVFKAEYAGSWDGQDGVRVRIARLVEDYLQEDEGWCDELTAGAKRMKGENKEAIEEVLEALKAKNKCT